VRKLLKTSPPGSVFKILEKKHTRSGTDWYLKKTKYPANTAPDQVKQYPYYCLIVVSLFFLTGRRLKVFLTNLGALGQRVQNISTSLRAFGQRIKKYFNKSWGIWNCGNIYSMKKKKTGRAFYFVE
jgi:hypothetical protein